MDHPRIRGEHPETSIADVDPEGSSPHTRGARTERHLFAERPGIIPAYAGSTDLNTSSTAPIEDHPRIRGEHSQIRLSLALEQGSSPHTRGAPSRRRLAGRRRRIIPAYAGSTLYFDKPQTRNWDHPRIRGEHLIKCPFVLRGVGSSPHTRGAPSNRSLRKCPLRIIPAYAGSTGPLVDEASEC